MHSKKTIAAMCFAVLLSGCGGGGGSNDDTPAFNVQDPQIIFLPNKPSLVSNPFLYPVESNTPFFSQLNVRIVADNGRNPPDTTIVGLTTNDVDILTLSVLDRGDTRDENEFTTRYGTICEGTVGGLATFFIHSNENPGTAIITASVQIPLTSGEVRGSGCRTNFESSFRAVSKTLNYQVTPAEPINRIAAIAERTTIAVNSLSIPASLGYPFATSVEVTRRDPLNRLVDGPISVVSVSPDILQLSTPTNFSAIGSSIQPSTVAGRANFFVHSLNKTGTAIIRISGGDSGSFVTTELTFTVTGASNSAPSQVSISTDQRPLYSQGSGGNTVLPIAVRIVDDNAQSVPDASAGVNNVFVEIVNVQGEVLVGRNAAGQTVERASFNARTLAGISNLVIRSGTRQGILQVKATADRADNNVDNGIQSPVSSFRPVVISDGKLFDLEITSPNVDAVIVNGVTPEIVVENPPAALPNGSYSLTVSALGTDRQGNPVLPGTPIEFGLIDHPTVGFPLQGPGQFAIAGSDGDPLEGGTLFTAPTGAFLTAGGGVGPGDTLLVYGENSPGNRDLESSRKVARAISQTQLDVQANTRFNLNDDSTGGVAVNRGPVLPYAVGRATFANIDNNKLTNDQGVASTKLNYPASAIGRLTAVWARGIGETPAGQVSPELVSDVENFAYPGVISEGGSARFSASPSSVTSGVATSVQLCVSDGLRNPIAGVFPTFNIQGGSGTVDGVIGNGRVRNATGTNGCTSASVSVVGAAGSTGGATTPSVEFRAVGQTANVTINAPAGARLLAIPERLGGSGGRVVLRLVDVQGNPLEGIQIFGTCTAGGAGGGTGGGVNVFIPPTLIDLPGRTNAAGETSAGISAQLNAFGAPSSGECIFTAATGPTARVLLQGIDECPFVFSPRPAGCPALPTAPTVALTIRLLLPNGNAYLTSPTQPLVTVFANAGGLNCTSTSATGCVSTVRQGSTVTLNAAPSGTASFCRWTGESECTSVNSVISVNADTALTCNAIFSPTGTTCP
jgi:hypothetical protein